MLCTNVWWATIHEPTQGHIRGIREGRQGLGRLCFGMKKETRGFSGFEGIISDETIDNISRVIYYRIIKEGMIFMKWADLKQDINSISQEEKDLIELTALLTNLRKNKNITQAEL